MILVKESDVLVIGTGGAGLRAAIEADERGASVLVVSKAPAGMNNATVVAGGGFRAAIDSLTPEEHYKDTLKVGNYLNDRRLMEVFTKEGSMRVLELKRFGVEMRVRGSGISVGDTPGLMGLGLTKPLVKYLRNKGVEIVENSIVTRLLVLEGNIVGAVGYDVSSDTPIVFASKAVILATGGAGAIYERTDCPLRTTGDGYRLGYSVGARLRDMEFVQFYPVALAESGFPPYLLGGYMTEEGQILNNLGENIPKKHGVVAHPLATKSRGPLSVAIMREIKAGNGIDGAVLIDIREALKNRSENEWSANRRYTTFRDKLKATERLLKVAPICHFNMGGIMVDENGETGIPGLYAAGEVVGGIHGANRHGGNALTDITVFGARAGATAAEYVQGRTLASVEPLVKSDISQYDKIRKGDSEEKVSPKDIMAGLRKTMWQKVGPVRSEEELEEAISDIIAFREKASTISASSGRELLLALEVPMALDTAEMIVRSAITRKESRGSHFREDYPLEDDNWLKTVIIEKNEDGKMKISTRSL